MLIYNKKIIKMLYGVDYNPELKIVKYEDKIGKTQKAMDTLEEIFKSNNKKILLIGPTGCGKTYSVSVIFDKLIQNDRKAIETLAKNSMLSNKQVEETIGNTYYVILCPNKIQNEQNQVEYGFKALVAGENVNYDDFKLSAVYEKAEDVLEIKKYNPNARIVMAIDESHELIDAIGYREKAIHKILELEKVADVVVYMTATFKPLQCVIFDKIFKFEDINYKGNTDNIKIIKSNNVIDVMNKKIIEEENSIFALNSKSYVLEKEEQLRELNRKVNVLISTDKYKTLDNPAYKAIIEESILYKQIAVHI